MQHIYITTSIPYVNAKPHLGFALELVLADALARSYKQQGHSVHFCTGSDENSTKNVLSATAAGQPLPAFIAEHAEAFRELGTQLNICSDDFVRTSVDVRHRRAVEALWRACERNGDIYLGAYEGWYCPGCEAFLADRDLQDGGCPEHAAPLQWLREQNYFFRLSRYAETLRTLITSATLCIRPEHRRHEVLAMLDAGLSDFSISRPRERAFDWGIPVPGDHRHIIYVWFDALVNYLSSLGYPDDAARVQREWQQGRVIHVVGKGVSRFHSIFWPAMLLSAGLTPPDEIWVHGYVTVNGAKISKSAGTALDPVEAANLRGVDALRHYLLAHVGSDHDGDFTQHGLEHAYTRELADTVGNLCSRTLAMVLRYRDGRLQPGDDASTTDPSGGGELPGGELRACSASLVGRFHNTLQNTSTHGAAQLVLEHARLLNAFVAQQAPWKLAKLPAQQAQLDLCLHTLVDGLRAIALCLLALLPSSAATLLQRLNAEPLSPGAALFPK